MNPNKKLRAARERAKLTQDQLAEAVGVSQAAISAYERGEFLPAAEVLGRIRHELGVRHNEDLGYLVIMRTGYEVQRIQS